MRSISVSRLLHAGKPSFTAPAASLIGMQECSYAHLTLQMSSSSLTSSCRGFASESANPGTRPPVSYLSFALTAATGAGLLWYYQNMMSARVQAEVKQATAGNASIGGPFDLLNQDGKPFTDKDLLGKFALVYFGFTHCPDICPDELEKMASALNGLGDQAKEIQPVFISIDPERDSVEQVREYVKEFYPGIIGLTGPSEKVKEAARQYRVYYTRAGDDDDEDYLIDHSIIMYLLNPKGEFVTFYGKNYTAEQLQASLKGFLSQ
ncbi:hypothetical protein WJX84_004143 [Apatococcus fuscideae]|uniref:Thioredoxin domain-containing protein n=1 Tax=Apatococcus fuscideae TaxID=2026836 RepID=A0AAW1TFZ5_9CHLO